MYLTPCLILYYQRHTRHFGVQKVNLLLHKSTQKMCLVCLTKSPLDYTLDLDEFDWYIRLNNCDIANIQLLCHYLCLWLVYIIKRDLKVAYFASQILENVK